MSKSKGAEKLKAITRKAKAEYNKKSNKKKWTTCIKEAARKLKRK
jgi:hypothetical protein